MNPPIAEWLDELREQAIRSAMDHLPNGGSINAVWDVTVGYEICLHDAFDPEPRCIRLINWVDKEMRWRMERWNRRQIMRPEDV